MTVEISIVVLTAICAGLTQAIKQIGVPSRFVPLMAVVIGIGVSLLAIPLAGLTIYSALLVGFIVGLSSVGLYSGIKNTAETPTENIG